MTTERWPEEVVWVELRYMVPIRVDYDPNDGRTREERAQAHADAGDFYEHLNAPYWPAEADYTILVDQSDMDLYDPLLDEERATHRVDVTWDPKKHDAR